MLRERVRAVLGRVPEPAKSWLKDHKEIAERSIARVKRKEVVLKQTLQGLRSKALDLRQWAQGQTAKAAEPTPVASAPAVSE